MKTRSLAMFSALVLFAASCEENINKGTVWDDPHFIRVTATREAMVERSEQKGFQWVLEDTISLFDQEYREVPIRNNEEGSRIFFSYDWTASAPGYAVYPRTEDIVFNAGYVTFSVPAEQPVSKLESFGPMVFVGKVTGNSSAYKLNPLKNTLSQLKLSMSDSTATSIKIESIAGEPLVGNVTVDCAKLTDGEDGFWTVAEDDHKSSTIIITPSEGSSAISKAGCLRAGAYYVSILPQNYSKGIRVTVERKDEETIVRTMGTETGCVASRSEVLEFEGDLDDTLPDEFTLEFVFSDKTNGIWPFVEDKVETDATYTYQYKYKFEGAEKTRNFEFFIYGNKSAYNLNKNGLCMMGKNSRITLPAVTNRYLKSVEMDVINTADKGFVLVDMDWKVITPTVNSIVNKPGKLTFPTADNIVTEKDTPYYMRYTAGSTFILRLTLVYSKTLDGVTE